MKQGNGAVGGTQRAVGSNNGAFMNLMQTQPMSGGNITKAKFKQPKPLTNTRGRSVPQERPSNS